MPYKKMPYKKMPYKKMPLDPINILTGNDLDQFQIFASMKNSLLES